MFDIEDILLGVLPLLLGWVADIIFGDPERLPHPVVLFGKVISFGERRLNGGERRVAKGAVMAVFLVAVVFLLTYFLVDAAYFLSPWLAVAVEAILVFYCLAGTTLIREVREVFLAAERSVEEGRRQVARIVGRDTSELSAQEVRTAALETLAENLSDGVIAPLFWYLLLGVPGMVGYKMVNTLDSMIGYRNERYLLFGRWAARMDDVANFVPARLTALLMIAVSGKWGVVKFVKHYGRAHLSPNSGFPEAAMAGILDCQFGGPHNYFGKFVWKPFIGSNARALSTQDMEVGVRINRGAEVVMVLIIIVLRLLF